MKVTESSVLESMSTLTNDKRLLGLMIGQIAFVQVYDESFKETSMKISPNNSHQHFNFWSACRYRGQSLVLSIVNENSLFLLGGNLLLQVQGAACLFHRTTYREQMLSSCSFAGWLLIEVCSCIVCRRMAMIGDRLIWICRKPFCTIVVIAPWNHVYS